MRGCQTSTSNAASAKTSHTETLTVITTAAWNAGDVWLNSRRNVNPGHTSMASISIGAMTGLVMSAAAATSATTATAMAPAVTRAAGMVNGARSRRGAKIGADETRSIS